MTARPRAAYRAASLWSASSVSRVAVGKTTSSMSGTTGIDALDAAHTAVVEASYVWPDGSSVPDVPVNVTPPISGVVPACARAIMSPSVPPSSTAATSVVRAPARRQAVTVIDPPMLLPTEQTQVLPVAHG